MIKFIPPHLLSQLIRRFGLMHILFFLSKKLFFCNKTTQILEQRPGTKKGEIEKVVCFALAVSLDVERVFRMATQLKTQKAHKNPSFQILILYQNRCKYCNLVDK